MLSVLAQTTTDLTYSTTELDSDSLAGLALFSGALLLAWLVVLVVTLVSLWKIFEKAGVEGWKAIIPGYNSWVLAEIAGKPGWWGIVGFGGIIPFIGYIFAIVAWVLYVLIVIELVKRFGKETIWAVLLILLPFVGFPMLAFGDAKYTTPKGGAATPTA